MTIAEQLNNLYQIKEDIKNIMIDSGIDMTNIPFSEYATVISEASKLDINKTKFGVSLLSFINPDAINLFDFVGTGIQNIGNYALQGTFAGNSRVQTAVFPDLTTISGISGCKYAFAYCNTLTAFNMPNLTTLSGEDCCWGMFINCTQLTTADLSAITEVSGDYACQGMFAHCYALNTTRFDNLSTVSGNFAFNNIFYECSSLTTISFPKLTTISNTNAFTDTFSNCNALTEIHFRYDMKEIVEGLDGYAERFGATNATIYFDLGDKVKVAIEPIPENAIVTFYQDDILVTNPEISVPLYAWTVEENGEKFITVDFYDGGSYVYYRDTNNDSSQNTAFSNPRYYSAWTTKDSNAPYTTVWTPCDETFSDEILYNTYVVSDKPTGGNTGDTMPAVAPSPIPETQIINVGQDTKTITYYTSKEIPSVGDLIYDINGNPTGQIITAVENNIITIE